MTLIELFGLFIAIGGIAASTRYGYGEYGVTGGVLGFLISSAIVGVTPMGSLIVALAQLTWNRLRR